MGLIFAGLGLNFIGALMLITAYRFSKGYMMADAEWGQMAHYAGLGCLCAGFFLQGLGYLI